MENKNKSLKIIAVILVLGSVVYYQMFLKRYYVYNENKTESITIWPTGSNICYIIPGEYSSFFHPKNNYIETAAYKNYIGVVWNTEDEYEYKISIYNSYKPKNLNENIKIYSKNDSLLLEYKMLTSLNVDAGERIVSKERAYYKERFDYIYIDMVELFGIEIR